MDDELKGLLDALDDADPRDLIATLDADNATAPGGKRKKSPAEELALGQLAIRTRARRRAFLDFSKIEKAVTQISRLPDPEESVHCIMGGDLNGWDLVPAIQKLAAAPIDDLIITTLGFNQNNNDQLCILLDGGQVKRATVLCSEYFRDSDPNTFQFALQNLRSRGQRLVATRNHSKIILAKIGEAAYVVESSANLRSCNNLEQLTLTRSLPLLEFHRSWIEHVIRVAGALTDTPKVNAQKETAESVQARAARPRQTARSSKTHRG